MCCFLSGEDRIAELLLGRPDGAGAPPGQHANDRGPDGEREKGRELGRGHHHDADHDRDPAEPARQCLAPQDRDVDDDREDEPAGRARQELAGQTGAPAAAIGRLTSRERDVLARIASGQTSTQIARALDISPGTVRKHVEHILSRLDVASRTAAAVCYITAVAPKPETPWTAVLASLHETR